MLPFRRFPNLPGRRRTGARRDVARPSRQECRRNGRQECLRYDVVARGSNRRADETSAFPGGRGLRCDRLGGRSGWKPLPLWCVIPAVVSHGAGVIGAAVRTRRPRSRGGRGLRCVRLGGRSGWKPLPLFCVLPALGSRGAGVIGAALRTRRPRSRVDVVCAAFGSAGGAAGSRCHSFASYRPWGPMGRA
jgi:hypothetical protein